MWVAELIWGVGADLIGAGAKGPKFSEDPSTHAGKGKTGANMGSTQSRLLPCHVHGRKCNYGIVNQISSGLIITQLGVPSADPGS